MKLYKINGETNCVVLGERRCFTCRGRLVLLEDQMIRDQMILDLSGTVEDAFKGFRYIVTIGDLVWSFSGTATPITAVTVLSTLWKYAIDESISFYQIRNQQKTWVHFGRHSDCGLKHPLHLLQQIV